MSSLRVCPGHNCVVNRLFHELWYHSSMEIALALERCSASISQTIYQGVNMVHGGDPGVIRTRDIRFRRPMLYPAELRGHNMLR